MDQADRPIFLLVKDVQPLPPDVQTRQDELGGIAGLDRHMEPQDFDPWSPIGLVDGADEVHALPPRLSQLAVQVRRRGEIRRLREAGSDWGSL